MGSPALGAGTRERAFHQPGKDLSVLEGEGQGMLFDLPEPAKLTPRLRSPQFPVWTEMKGALVSEYLRLFIMITHSGTYIDLFAGPQDPVHPESWAAKRVLEMRPPWLRHFHLMDSSESQVARLMEMKDELGLGRDIHVYKGDSNEVIDHILRPALIRQREPVFALLDQRCFECRWETLEKLARYKDGHKIELLYFMPEGWLDRSLAAIRRPEKRLEVDGWWGRSGWDTELRTISGLMRAEAFVERFREDLGYKHVTAWSICSRADGGRTMYFMIHASDHDEAPKLMARAYNKTCIPVTRLQQMAMKI